MNKISIEKKVEIALESIKRHKFTAYEISKGTTLSTLAIQNIITGKTKKPSEKTINEILSFLEDNMLGTNVKEVNEDKEDYNKLPPLTLDDYNICLKKNLELMEEIIRLQKILYKNEIEF